MPKKEIDYSNTVIYKIVCNDLNVDDCYVGHTTNFKQRKSQHKHSCMHENSKKIHIPIYRTIRKNGGWDNWIMIEIEKYPCNDTHEACKRERYWYESLKSSLNSKIPSQTHSEYYENNKVKISDYHKKYRIDNKVKLKEKKDEYYKENKDIIISKTQIYRANNKDKIKETNNKYYENNKEQIRAKNKIYKDKNKEKIKEINKLYHAKKKHQNI